nr:peptidoglycan recognition family protein [Nocardioides albus]
MVAAGTLLSGLVVAVPLTAAASGSGTDWGVCLEGSRDRQAVFDRAAETSGVPKEVLLAVSYMESRWDAHGESPSTSGGYGPMHLTDLPALAQDTEAHPDPLGKGDGSDQERTPQQREEAVRLGEVETLRTANDLTGIPVADLRADAVANICGGAAVLADYQKAAGGADELADWSAAVGRYSGAADEATALKFARQVFSTLSEGESRTTNDGHEVTLAAKPVTVSEEAVGRLDLADSEAAAAVECPVALGCESLPAPYEQTGDSIGDYGNHDLADRPEKGSVDYIVIHDTETSYNGTVRLVQNPTYLGWHYTLRSVDGHVAHHIPGKNIGWHAGNWYVNSHSIGLEHEGYAANGAWYTEAMYQTSATLVGFLAEKYDVPLDRAHIIGHDQVQGVAPANVAGMHWDPGPYWDWNHYFDLLGSPIMPDRRSRSDIWTVKPDFQTNTGNVMTGCTTAGVACPNDRGTNFVNVYSAPSTDAPLLPDTVVGGSARVSNWGPRLAAGQKVVVNDRTRPDWWGVWFGGKQGWIQNPDEALLPSDGKVITPKPGTTAKIYGTAYPTKASDYPAGVTPRTIAPLQYTIPTGQEYVVADAEVPTDYYKANNFNCAAVNGVPDCIVISGDTTYYQIWFNHRIAYVMAEDVTVTDG